MVVPNQVPKKPRKTRAKPNDSHARSLPVDVPTSSAPLKLINPDAAGIDVHSDMHMVCVPADREAKPVRQFGANTADLHEIAAWLKKCGVKTVAMESTGVYWIPLFEFLESQGFQVHLVEPGQLSRCGIARRPTSSTRSGSNDCTPTVSCASFRPPDTVLALRAYWRQRQMQVRYAAYHVQHMQKAMEQMNVKLAEVVNDITGLTGMSIIDAILGGERSPIRLAKLRDPRCQKTKEQIALALEGTWRPEHLFELRQARELYRFHHQQITECDVQVEAELAKFSDRAGEKTQTAKPRKGGKKNNNVRFDANGPLFKALGVDLTLIEGIDVGTALVILAEIGVDISRFPTEKHFASWLRLCPPQNESNRTKRRLSHRKATNRVTIALRLSARVVGRTMTPLGLFYRRIRSRIGGRGAVKATAHKLACLIYRMLKYGEEYVTQSMEEYEVKMTANVLKSLERKAAAMGFQLTPLPSP